jgi:hypothetical protein
MSSSTHSVSPLSGTHISSLLFSHFLTIYQSAYPSCCRLSRLPPLLHPRLLRYRTIWSATGHDDLCGGVLYMLGDHLHRTGAHRRRSSELLQLRCRRCNIFLRLLRLFWNGCSWRAVVIPYGNQCIGDENEGCQFGNGDELDCESLT